LGIGLLVMSAFSKLDKMNPEIISVTARLNPCSVPVTVFELKSQG